MEKSTDNNFFDLLNLKTQVDTNLLEENLPKDRAAFYEALKTLIDVKINEEEIYFKFDKLEEVFTAVALGNFTTRLDIPRQKNLFSFLATSINAVIEELEANVSKNALLISSLQCIPDAAIITDTRGSISFANDKATMLLNRSLNDTIKLMIQNVFELQMQFGTSGEFELKEDAAVKIRPYNQDLISVRLTVKQIKGKNDELEGYIYLIKEN